MSLPRYKASNVSDAHTEQRRSMMFEKSEWSDLKIKTATQTFDVHRNIVCTACPFLEAACTGDWKEARAGVVEMPEPEYIVSAVLAYCYGLFNTEDFDREVYPYDWRYGEKIGYCELLVAADKYRMEGLKIMVTDHLVDKMSEDWNGDDLASIALWLWEGERRQIFGPQLTREAMIELALELDFLIGSMGKWVRIASNVELSRDLVRFVARRSSRVRIYDEPPDDMYGRTSEYLCVNSSDTDADE
ncbi:hypothetical protein CKM354_001160900 [Cercospora kikuchii]|uniref:BTB domain-containing protein n=1 Tax=Cercospora kikuchii TaxID=84275 RepID=A0A9P3FLB5_9PEZI|nr:uncharacterized protein CKM354_001160900 [Cercospora kikuchii]GIZ48555.1 hypothetical protein CKM354_001160900 [Cercospora kikuchii]